MRHRHLQSARPRTGPRRGRLAPLVGVCAGPAPLAAGLAAWIADPPLCAAVASHPERELDRLMAVHPRLIVATEAAALRTVLPVAGAAVPVLVLADGLTPDREALLLSAGATGAADVDAGRAALVRMVRDALEGRPVASPAAVRILAAGGGRGDVTPRQRQILALLADGRSTAEVADALCIAPSTVKTHVARIGERLGVPGRRALAKAAPAILGHPHPVRTALAEAAATRSPTQEGTVRC